MTRTLFGVILVILIGVFAHIFRVEKNHIDNIFQIIMVFHFPL